MIYFVQALDGGPVKIGYTDDFEQRFRDLEKHYQRPLTLLASMEGGRKEERAIHVRFAHLRYDKTEQFRPAADLMEFIDRPTHAVADPDSVEAMAWKERNKKPDRLVVNLRGTPEYVSYLDEVIEAMIAAGTDIKPRQYTKLAEIALGSMGTRLGEDPTPRAAPMGRPVGCGVKRVERMPPPGRKPTAKRKPKGKPAS